jgi:hypothetical protein
VESDLAAFGSTADGAGQVQGCRCGSSAGQDEALQGFEFPFEDIDTRFEPFDVGIFRLWDRNFFSTPGARRSQVTTEVE